MKKRQRVSPVAPFVELGRCIEDRWRSRNFDIEHFPEVARIALAEADLPSRVDPWDVVEWGRAEPVLPVQRDLPGRFGDLPLTLYNGSRFYIDVYLWLDGTTAIHQHGFSGAFQVLGGSSLHSTYDFEVRERANTHLAIGDLECQHAELLTVGEVREILPGSAFIHALFHLDRPSTSIVVRTVSDIEHQPQYSYEKPGIAHDPFFSEANLTKKLQTYRLLLNAGRPEADDALVEALEDADFQSSMTILSFARPMLHGNRVEQFLGVDQHESRFERLLQVTERRHGSLAKPLRELYTLSDARSTLVSRRQIVEDAELRFFLALVLNLEERQRILALVAERFPGDEPQEKVLDWVSELGQIRVFGGTDNALGVPDYSDIDVLVLEELMNGVPVPGLAAALGDTVGDADVDLAERARVLAASPVLGPLLS